MTLLSDRLQEAGADTATARLAVLATESLRENGGSLAQAASALWKKLTGEAWVARDAWIIPYLRERQRDMKGAATPEPENTREPATPPRPQAKPNPKQKAKIDKIIKKAVDIVTFGYKVSDGRDVATVGIHERHKFQRDGALFDELEKELPVLTGNMRFANFGEILTAKQFKAARERANV